MWCNCIVIFQNRLNLITFYHYTLQGRWFKLWISYRRIDNLPDLSYKLWRTKFYFKNSKPENSSVTEVCNLNIVSYPATLVDIPLFKIWRYWLRVSYIIFRVFGELSSENSPYGKLLPHPHLSYQGKLTLQGNLLQWILFIIE